LTGLGAEDAPEMLGGIATEDSSRAIEAVNKESASHRGIVRDEETYGKRPKPAHSKG
jgi:hypothetical protein